MLMDGGSNNRKFIKLHAGPEAHLDWKVKNPMKANREVICMMDPCVS
jgi:hypothetical protein